MARRWGVLAGLFFLVPGVRCAVAGQVPASSGKADQTKTAEEVRKRAGIWIPPDLSAEEKEEWKNGRPPGWSRGSKAGWGGRSMPPGLAKKIGEEPVTKQRKRAIKERGSVEEGKKGPPNWESLPEEKKQEWKNSLEKLGEIIRRRTSDRTAVDTMIFSAQAAALSGVPIEILNEITDRFITRKLSAAEYEQVTRALAYGVGKDVDFSEVGGALGTRIDQGVRGDDLAVGVYREIAARHRKKTETR